MKRPLAIIVPALAIASACGGQATGAAAPEPRGETSGSASAIIAPQPATARTVTLSNDLFAFSYAYPAAAAAIPSLRAVLEADMAKQRAALARDARRGRADARTNGFDYRPYALGYEWQVVTELPGWLSLSAGTFSDTGGAHPNHGYDALLWDKSAGRRVAVADLFLSSDALSGAIRKDFCAQLDRERARRRDRPVDPSRGSDFDRCIDPLAQTVILGSASGKAFDRIGILVGPYAAGPYAEGDYEITLPVNARVMAALKPEYRAAFSRRR